ncbi:hypothetical protein BW35_02068 [Micrococcus luteus]|nr:hypothetical protein BW35_02068 [Micrococcus luteus]
MSSSVTVPAVSAAGISPASRYAWAASRISNSPVSEETGTAPAWAIFMPLYSAGLCEAVNTTPAACFTPAA